MFCKNCGKEIDPQAAICIGCGFRNGDGNRYCGHCGQPLLADAVVCLSCGFSTRPAPTQPVAPVNAKSKLVAGLLALFLGGLGIHNFYLGFTGKGIAQILLSCTGISSIWALIEAIMIFAGKIDADANGDPLVD